MKSKRPAARQDPNVYPPGWNRKRVQSIIEYYDPKADQDVLGDEATTKAAGDLVWVEVPEELVPRVRKLISRYRRTA
jgi:hypothetical protein